MQAAYSALRRFSLYQAMIQVVDAGDARAYCVDDWHWTARQQSPEVRAISTVSVDSSAATADDLMKSFNDRPPQPCLACLVTSRVSESFSGTPSMVGNSRLSASGKLLNNYAMYPGVLNKAAMRAGLVSAKPNQAG